MENLTPFSQSHFLTETDFSGSHYLQLKEALLRHSVFLSPQQPPPPPLLPGTRGFHLNSQIPGPSWQDANLSAMNQTAEGLEMAIPTP